LEQSTATVFAVELLWQSYECIFIQKNPTY